MSEEFFARSLSLSEKISSVLNAFIHWQSILIYLIDLIVIAYDDKVVKFPLLIGVVSKSWINNLKKKICENYEKCD